MRNIVIYILIFFIICFNILAFINGIEMSKTYGREIIKPSTFIIAALLSIWIITKLLKLLKTSKQETNENTTLTSTPDNIITNTTSKKPSWFKQGINFLTFDTLTYRSVFDEGQRRLMMVVSIIAPILFSYIWFYDFEDGYLPSDWPVASPIFYIIFHVIILVYIWIREGSGNVRAGGNAGKSLWNLVKIGLISYLIVAAVAISFQEYERVQEQKRIEEDKKVVKEKTENYFSCVTSEDVFCLMSLVEQEQKEQVKDAYTKEFTDCNYGDISLSNVNVERNTLEGYNYTYEISGNIDYDKNCRKKRFEQNNNSFTFKFNEYLEIINISFQ